MYETNLLNSGIKVAMTMFPLLFLHNFIDYVVFYFRCCRYSYLKKNHQLHWIFRTNDINIQVRPFLICTLISSYVKSLGKINADVILQIIIEGINHPIQNIHVYLQTETIIIIIKIVRIIIWTDTNYQPASRKKSQHQYL